MVDYIDNRPDLRPYQTETLADLTPEPELYRLAKAPRTLSHIERYSLKEANRDRVPVSRLNAITGRSQLGELWGPGLMRITSDQG